MVLWELCRVLARYSAFMNQELIGVRIARHRKARGLSQSALGHAPGVSISREVLANIEGGRKPDITVGQLIAIAKALHVSPATLAIPAEEYAEAEWFCEPPLWFSRLRTREAAEILRQGWHGGMSANEMARYGQALDVVTRAAESAEME
jgi:transcriptional regulator with XRE-family HTH domain